MSLLGRLRISLLSDHSTRVDEVRIRKPRQSNQKYKCAPMTKANITPMIATAIGHSIKSLHPRLPARKPHQRAFLKSARGGVAAVRISAGVAYRNHQIGWLNSVFRALPTHNCFCLTPI